MGTQEKVEHLCCNTGLTLLSIQCDRANRGRVELERCHSLSLSKLTNFKPVHQGEQALISEHTFYFHPNFFVKWSLLNYQSILESVFTTS